MSEAEKILKKILSDEKLLSSRAFSSKVYHDEPILRRASQLRPPDVPQKIKDMKAIAFSPEAYWKTNAWLFYTQGKFMEDFTLEADISAEAKLSYPVYRDMETPQLISYFSWRTKIRRGEYVHTCDTFTELYFNELINDIGTSSPEDSQQKMDDFLRNYQFSDPRDTTFLRRLKTDHAIYSGLDCSFIADSMEIQTDNAAVVLICPEVHTDEELFDAICRLSVYDIRRSRFYAADSSYAERIVCSVFRSLTEHFRQNRKRSLFENLFGKISECSYHIFFGAVHFDRGVSADREYIASPVRKYVLSHGKWSCIKYRTDIRCSALGDLIRSIDAAAREITGYQFKLRLANITRDVMKFTQDAVSEIEKEKAAAKARSITIDVSALQAIRNNSDITREKLIVEEEEEMPVPAPVQEISAPEREDDDFPLSGGEISFLEAVLEGSGWKEAASAAGSMPSLLTDSINEKLYDLFSDTVLGQDGDTPFVIEDYTDDIRHLIQERRLL